MEGESQETADSTGQSEADRLSNRAEVIQATIREIQALEAKRHEIGAQIRAIKQAKVKAGLGMKIGDFNAALRLASLEDEARDGFLDTLKETFAALGVGGQLSFLDAAPAPAAEKPKRGRPRKNTVVSRDEERQKSGFEPQPEPFGEVGVDPAEGWPEVA